MHGEMKYMENHFEMRLNPKLIVEDAKSVISLLYNYYPTQKQTDNTFKLARYAYGNDYHEVIKDKLSELLMVLKDKIGDFNARIFTDSAPVLEKTWAKKSGLGWIGKNSNLINKSIGSYFFIAEIITDLKLNYDSATGDFCGTCTKCIDACPTHAITSPKVVNGSKCISYLTIELKNQIPAEFNGKMNDWIFGCDICQEVCPWNRFSKPSQEPLFEDKTGKLSLSKEDWKEITEDVFQKLFKKSAVKRTKFTGLIRNINFAGK